MEFDNIVIHYYAGCFCVAACAVNLRQGNKIVFRLALKNIKAADNWIKSRGYNDKPRRIIWHWI